MQIARVAFRDAGGADTAILVRFAWEIGGAVAFGVLVGALFALYMRYIGREVTLVLLGVCTVLSQVGSTQEFEPLLAAVAAGLVIENLAVAQGDTLRAAVQRGAPPVLVVFFAAVGASLRLDALAAIGYVALALSRGPARRSSTPACGSGGALAGLDERLGKYAWTGLVSQAGITLGFASVVAAEFPGWGTQIQLLLVGLIAIHELVGPIAVPPGTGARRTRSMPTCRRPLVVVSNREPYLHTRGGDGQIVANAATGGVAIALDALMRERGGVWIAHGAGSADRRGRRRRRSRARSTRAARPTRCDGSGSRSRRSPPTTAGSPTKGLWPLCHVVDVRPKFRAEDWAAYQDVNGRFAAAVHTELGTSTAPVFIQDYHLALVAPALRRGRPDAQDGARSGTSRGPTRIAFASARGAASCSPGLLGNDLLAFQLERDRDNFLRAVEEELEAEVETESSRVRFDGRSTHGRVGADWRRLRPHSGDGRRSVRCRRNSSG